MNKFIDDLMKKGMGNFMDQSRDELMWGDEIHKKAREEEDEWEKKVKELGLSKKQDKVIDKYISSIFTVTQRYADISYMAGIKDTVGMLVSLGMLKGVEMEGDCNSGK